jgi:hypothetical protein
MGDGRTHGDQRLPWPEAVNDENGMQSDLAGKVFWALFALLLMSAVAVVSYLTGRGSRQEPIVFGSETLPAARQAPTTIPQPAPSPPAEMEAAPPVARMLEAQSEPLTAVAEQRVEEQSISPSVKERPSPPVPQFRPPSRVQIARRAIARRTPLQPRRVLYASRVVELGNYRNRRLAQAAHKRLVRVYPYVKTLPRTIMPVEALNGKSRAFHLRLTADSPEYARILCQNLVSIGRGCAVLPEPA